MSWWTEGQRIEKSRKRASCAWCHEHVQAALTNLELQCLLNNHRYEAMTYKIYHLYRLHFWFCSTWKFTASGQMTNGRQPDWHTPAAKLARPLGWSSCKPRSAHDIYSTLWAPLWGDDSQPQRSWHLLHEFDAATFSFSGILGECSWWLSGPLKIYKHLTGPLAFEGAVCCFSKRKMTRNEMIRQSIKSDESWLSLLVSIGPLIGFCIKTLFIPSPISFQCSSQTNILLALDPELCSLDLYTSHSEMLKGLFARHCWLGRAIWCLQNDSITGSILSQSDYPECYLHLLVTLDLAWITWQSHLQHFEHWHQDFRPIPLTARFGPKRLATERYIASLKVRCSSTGQFSWGPKYHHLKPVCFLQVPFHLALTAGHFVSTSDLCTSTGWRKYKRRRAI